MLDIALNTSKYSIPTTITAAGLHVASISGPNQLPVEYYLLPHFVIKQRSWEEQYIPRALNDDGKIERINGFASNLLQDAEDIPEEFAKILNEDFWDII